MDREYLEEDDFILIPENAMTGPNKHTINKIKNMVLRSYKSDNWDDEDETPLKKMDMGSTFVDLKTMKKLNFSDVDFKEFAFGDIKEIMQFNHPFDAYLGSYSETEFYAYNYQKFNGTYPDVLKIENVDTEKFIVKLFGYVDIPKSSYSKSLEFNRDETSLNSIIIYFKLDNDNAVLMYVDSDSVMLFYNKTQENNKTGMLHNLLGLIKTYCERKLTKNKIYVVYQTSHGFEKMGFDIRKFKVNLEENYNDDFPEVSKEIIKGLNSSSKTNLVILSGASGTGKTFFVRYLTSKLKKNIIFISPDMVNQITDPAFIPFLMKNNNSILIIEDAEPALESRAGNGRTGAVSNVLNLTDGLLSDCLNISIIATFNTNTKNIDEALLRKGRLLKNYKFEKLSKEKSKALLAKFGHDVDVKEPMTLADIYCYAENNNCEDLLPKRSMGFGGKTVSN